MLRHTWFFNRNSLAITPKQCLGFQCKTTSVFRAWGNVHGEQEILSTLRTPWRGGPCVMWRWYESYHRGTKRDFHITEGLDFVHITEGPDVISYQNGHRGHSAIHITEGPCQKLDKFVWRYHKMGIGGPSCKEALKKKCGPCAHWQESWESGKGVCPMHNWNNSPPARVFVPCII